MMASMKTFWLVILTASLLAASAAAAWDGETEAPAGENSQAAEILNRLDARLTSINSMEGAFIQTFVSSGLGIPQTEEGRFYIKRPDLMRWEYTKPEEKLAVSDGTNTWLYLPEEKTVYRGTVKKWKEGGAFSMLAGGSLEKKFRALEVGVEGASRSGDLLLRLQPRSSLEQFEFLNLQFDPKSLTINMITAIDGMGNRVSMILSGVRENVVLPGDYFEFAPPPGTQVVDQAPPATPAEATGSPQDGR